MSLGYRVFKVEKNGKSSLVLKRVFMDDSGNPTHCSDLGSLSATTLDELWIEIEKMSNSISSPVMSLEDLVKDKS
jgi:hypothetical protein